MKWNKEKFCVFILTHRRPQNIKTLKMLEQGGYTGRTFLVVDNEDETQGEYSAKYGNSVIIFDKKKAAEITDTADNQPVRRGVVYARNYVFEVAKQIGIDYFLVLDDDYQSIDFRYVDFEDKEKFKAKKCRNLDELFKESTEFLITSGAVTVAFAQTGDYIGGKDGFYSKKLSRKAMNSFFCMTERPFLFSGRINEDVNAYVSLGAQGKLFFTLTNVSVQQTQTQANPGGLTEIYLDTGTYVKSFYSVIIAPSCVKVAEMGGKHRRLHHRISWDNCTPKILNEKYRKEQQKNGI